MSDGNETAQKRLTSAEASAQPSTSIAAAANSALPPPPRISGYDCAAAMFKTALKRKNTDSPAADLTAKRTSQPSPSSSTSKKSEIDDAAETAKRKLRERASLALINEAKRSAERVERMGPQGWLVKFVL